MASGHGRFGFLNRTGNPILKALLRSPLHGVASGRLALITVTGRRTGRRFTFPVGYTKRDDRVTIGVGWPERKVWWRNLRQPAPVKMRIRGQSYTGTAVADGDEQSGVRVNVTLDR
jgi:F420H(2)-dependent quinone reductase